MPQLNATKIAITSIFKLKPPNMILDRENKAFNLALDLAEYTDYNLFLTGKAGTGKSTFLTQLQKQSEKKIIVLAPTGVAAVNVGGVTIHSFFQMGIEMFPPNHHALRNKSSIKRWFGFSEEKVKIIQKTDIFIIDEVSMVRCELLDAIDKILRAYTGKSEEAFGGKQMILIGDPYQLPPIVKTEDRTLLSNFYSDYYYFNANSFSDAHFSCIELTKIYRQKEDKVFMEVLNQIRENQLTTKGAELLYTRKTIHPFDANTQEGIFLGTHNETVRTINHRELGKINSPEKVYQATVTGEFTQNEFPADYRLSLKVGAQVMFLVNDTTEWTYYNGKIGTVTELADHYITVEKEDGGTVTLARYSWEKKTFEWNEETQEIESKVIGKFEQFPLRLAWAITVHKSQGLTFEKVYANLASSWDNGQVYVGLSRCTSLGGLQLNPAIPHKAIKTSEAVKKFYQEYTSQDLAQIELLIRDEKARRLLEKAQNAIQEYAFNQGLEHLEKALKIKPDLDLSDLLLSLINAANYLKMILEAKEGALEQLQTDLATTKENAAKQEFLMQTKINVLERKERQKEEQLIRLQEEKKTLVTQSIRQKSEIKQLQNRKWWQLLFGIS